MNKHITGYLVEMCESNKQWQKVAYISGVNNTEFTVGGLEKSGEYFFRISAENASGFSQPLQTDCISTCKQTGMYSSRSSISGKRMSREGDIYGYERNSISGRLSDAAYGSYFDFSTRASSPLGSKYLLLPPPPHKPVTVSKYINNSLIVRWKAPLISDVKQLPLLGYTIEVKESEKERWKKEGAVDGVTFSHVLENLSTDKKYQVRVRARNNAGDGEATVAQGYFSPGRSSTSNSPSAPCDLKIFRMSSNEITLKWKAPLDGSVVSRYVILKKSKLGEIWEEATNSNNCTCVVTDLRPGSSYYFAVFATNAHGRSDQIETTMPVTLRRTSSIAKRSASYSNTFENIGPLKITSFTHDSVGLSWSPYPGSSDVTASDYITGYRIEMRETGTVAWKHVGNVDSGESEYVVRGLHEGTDYQFRVLAENILGASFAPINLDTPFAPKKMRGIQFDE